MEAEKKAKVVDETVPEPVEKWNSKFEPLVPSTAEKFRQTINDNFRKVDGTIILAAEEPTSPHGGDFWFQELPEEENSETEKK